jgi:hypothetical protein
MKALREFYGANLDLDRYRGLEDFTAETAITVRCGRCGVQVTIPNDKLQPLDWCRDHAASGCPVMREDRFMAAVDRLTDAIGKVVPR